MFRGVLACGVLGALGQQGCPDCNLDVTALEKFSTNFEVKLYQIDPSDASTGWHPNFCGSVITMPLPPMLPTEHGTIAVDARNFYAKISSDVQFPTPFSAGPVDLSGHHVRAELHVNGIAGKASWHLDSQMVKGCITVDLPPPITDQIAQMAPMIDAQLQQAEATAPMMAQQMGLSGSVDGEDCVFLGSVDGAAQFGIVGFSKTHSHPLVVVTPCCGHPPGRNLALKFSDYSDSAGDESIRACQIAEQDAMQTFLTSSPDARAFVTSQIAQHQRHLQATLQPKSLNTRFNFVPLELAELLVPAEQHCASALAETPAQSVSVAGTVVFAMFSFFVGVAVNQGLMRQRKVALADQVSA